MMAIRDTYSLLHMKGVTSWYVSGLTFEDDCKLSQSERGLFDLWQCREVIVLESCILIIARMGSRPS